MKYATRLLNYIKNPNIDRRFNRVDFVDLQINEAFKIINANDEFELCIKIKDTKYFNLTNNTLHDMDNSSQEQFIVFRTFLEFQVDPVMTDISTNTNEFSLIGNTAEIVKIKDYIDIGCFVIMAPITSLDLDYRILIKISNDEFYDMAHKGTITFLGNSSCTHVIVANVIITEYVLNIPMNFDVSQDAKTIPITQLNNGDFFVRDLKLHEIHKDRLSTVLSYNVGIMFNNGASAYIPNTGETLKFNTESGDYPMVYPVTAEVNASPAYDALTSSHNDVDVEKLCPYVYTDFGSIPQGVFVICEFPGTKIAELCIKIDENRLWNIEKDYLILWESQGYFTKVNFNGKDAEHPTEMRNAGGMFSAPFRAFRTDCEFKFHVTNHRD